MLVLSSHLLADQRASRTTPPGRAHGIVPEPALSINREASVSRVPIDNLRSEAEEFNHQKNLRVAATVVLCKLREAEAAMRIHVFFLALALLAVVAQSSSRHHRHYSHVQTKGHGDGGGGHLADTAERPAARSWPCCDSCGGCSKSVPARCQCLDAAPRGCHPACRDCVRSSLSVDPPVYQCMDRVPNFCHRRCTAAAAAH